MLPVVIIDSRALQHGVKGLHKSMLILPSLKSHCPNRNALEWRRYGSVCEIYLNKKSDSVESLFYHFFSGMAEMRAHNALFTCSEDLKTFARSGSIITIKGSSFIRALLPKHNRPLAKVLSPHTCPRRKCWGRTQRK